MTHRVFDFRQPACLSPLQHKLEDNHDDIKSHFFGCLLIKDRLGFLSENNELWQKLVEAQYKRQNAATWRAHEKLPDTDTDQCRRMRWQVCESLQEEFRKTDVVRNAIKNDLMLGHLVSNIDASRGEWRRNKKVYCRTPVSQPTAGPTGLRASDTKETTDGYPLVRAELERIVGNYVEMSSDIRANEIQFNHEVSIQVTIDDEDGAVPTQTDTLVPTQGHPLSGDDRPQELTIHSVEASDSMAANEKQPNKSASKPKYEIDKAIKARVMRFERDAASSPFVGKSIEQFEYSGIFPEQEIEIRSLFSRWVGGQFCRMPDMGRESKTDIIRYYHIPCNNMKVRAPDVETMLNNTPCRISGC